MSDYFDHLLTVKHIMLRRRWSVLSAYRFDCCMKQEYLMQFLLKFCCSWARKTRQQDSNADVRGVLEFLAVVKPDKSLSIPEVRDCQILIHCFVFLYSSS